MTAENTLTDIVTANITCHLLNRLAERDRQIKKQHLQIRRQEVEIALLRTIIADQKNRIDHLLDQPLVILNGDAFVGSKDYGQPCPN